MVNKEKLQEELRNVDGETSAYDLAKKFNCHIDELLLLIQDQVMIPYKEKWNGVKFKIPFFKEEQLKEFFSSDIIDLGYLCQHKITEIKEGIGSKLNTFAHQTMYNNWVMYRGY